tara:strand:- start:1508 stop:4615 length:3108 start_codon:yes stop_codon:yes gene_type:complete
MSSNVLGAVVGGAVGFLVGGPAGALIGAGIGLAGSALVGGLGVGYDGPRLSDLSIQTSTYGADIPRVHGTIVVSGNVLWLENGKLRERVRKVSSGGKGGGSSATKEYTYYATFHLGLCEGPVAAVRRIWCSDKLIYDAGSDDLETIIASNESAKKWTFYDGSDDQLPSARYQADVGADNASARRGLCYIEFRDFALEDYGNTLEGAQFRVELAANSSVTRPTYMFDRPMQGEVVYSDAAIVQTAVANAGRVVDDRYYGSVTFFTYNHRGRLLRVGYGSASVPVSGTTSLTFYKSLFLRGVKDSMFVYRLSGTGLAAGAISGTIELSTAEADKAYVRTSWGDFLPTATDVKVHRDGLFFSIVYAGVNHQSFQAIEHQGRLFAKYVKGFDLSLWFAELSPEGGGVLWEQRLGTGGEWANAAKIAVTDGRLAVHASGFLRVYEIGPNSVTLIGQLALSGRGPVYPFAPGFAVTGGGRVYQVTDRRSTGPEPLANVVTRQVERSALLSAADVDVSELTTLVRGYRHSGGSIRAALEPLAVAYQFDIVPSGYKLKAVPRGQVSVLTVPYADLGATASDTPSDVFKLSREMDSQLPAKTVVKYLDAAREYDIGEQSSARINTEAVNEVESELALVLNADEAAGIAEVLQSRAWLERTDVSFTLPQTYLALEPCDVITVQTPDANYELLCSELEYTQDGRIEVKAKPSAAAIYIPNASGGEGSTPPGTIGVAGPSLFVPMDIPVVNEELQNRLGFVGVMTGYTDGWPGGVLYRSTDAGQTWTDIQGWAAKCTIGTAAEALGQHAGYLIDQTEIPVSAISGELVSVTREQMISGANYCAYGVDGRWEIVRFQDAELQSDGSYLVSNWVRGDKGTEWATGLHQPGDWLILLDDPDNIFITMATESLTLERLYRAITQRDTIDSGDDVAFAYRGVNLEPLSAIDASGERDGSGNLAVEFTRRSRLTSSWWTTGVTAPVGEFAEAYEIDVLDGANVVRTITAAAPLFSYSAADQAVDFGSPQGDILFRIYQLSDVVGRGYVYEVTL